VKRAEELAPLSHDHHQALFVAMRLKRAEDLGAGDAFTEFIEGKGEEHFHEEETILLPAWAAADPEADLAMVARVLSEHVELRAAGRRLRARGLSLAELHGLGELLDAHVRFEERELFPLIERRLDGASLRRLGAEIAAAHEACAESG
jgi:hemerythrin-like domain-containing protein